MGFNIWLQSWPQGYYWETIQTQWWYHPRGEPFQSQSEIIGDHLTLCGLDHIPFNGQLYYFSCEFVDLLFGFANGLKCDTKERHTWKNLGPTPFPVDLNPSLNWSGTGWKWRGSWWRVGTTTHVVLVASAYILHLRLHPSLSPSTHAGNLRCPVPQTLLAHNHIDTPWASI